MKRVPLELDEALYERIKEAAGDVPVNRWIRRAIEDRLKLVEGYRALDEFPKRVAASQKRDR